MTEKIDLDDIDTGEQDDDEETGNRGDWIWRDEGDPDGEPDASPDDPEPTDPTDAVPHVPDSDKKRPAGIPKEQGGSGAGASGGTDAREPQHPEGSGTASASGPHGGGVDDMTTAFTYEALARVDDVQLALAETNEWSDWVGIVGDVEAHEINKFQRDNQLDVDFFNGSGDGPAERLADVDRNSMFYAERMVVVGTVGEEWIAEEAGWEFVPLADAAEGAGWEYDAPPEDGE